MLMSLYFTWDLPYTLPSSLPLISSIALASKTLSSLMQNKTLNPAFPSTNLFLQVPQKLQSFWKSGLGRSHYFCLIFKPPSQTHLLPRRRETALHRNREIVLHKNRETIYFLSLKTKMGICDWSSILWGIPDKVNVILNY